MRCPVCGGDFPRLTGHIHDPAGMTMGKETLIVCREEPQLREAKLAFGEDFARFELIGAVLAGARFSKIIVLANGPFHPEEARFLRETLPTRLRHKGELYFL